MTIEPPYISKAGGSKTVSLSKMQRSRLITIERGESGDLLIQSYEPVQEF